MGKNDLKLIKSFLGVQGAIFQKSPLVAEGKRKLFAKSKKCGMLLSTKTEDKKG